MATQELRERPEAANEPDPDGSPTLGNYWHPLCLSEDVTEQPRAFTLLDEQVVAFRDAEGVAAFKDLCIHRGTALSLGWITDGRLTCAYHGWEYDRTGACVHIPSLPPGASIPRKARAIAYRAEERYGLVWVAMADPVAPIPDWPHVSPPDPDYELFLVGRWVWESSAGRVIENGMDFSHFNFVHTGLTELADGPEIKPHEIHEVEHGIVYEYDDSLITRRYRVYVPFVLHDEKIQRSGDTSVISIIAAPRTSTTSEVYVFVTRNHQGAVALKGAGQLQGRDEVRAFTDEVFGQDRRIVESQRPHEIPTDLRDELHLKVPDANALTYRRLLGRIHGIEPHLP
jgi:phenylpropionate dioxygenase-like ring-hydroxylating dioxygenase large terminal subunit